MSSELIFKEQIWGDACAQAGIARLRARLAEAEGRNIALEEENIALGEENIALEEKNVALDEENIALEEENIALKEGDIALEGKNIALEEENIELEERNFALEEENARQKELIASFTASSINDAKKAILQKKQIANLEEAVVSSKKAIALWKKNHETLAVRNKPLEYEDMKTRNTSRDTVLQHNRRSPITDLPTELRSGFQEGTLTDNSAVSALSRAFVELQCKLEWKTRDVSNLQVYNSALARERDQLVEDYRRTKDLLYQAKQDLCNETQKVAELKEEKNCFLDEVRDWELKCRWLKRQLKHVQKLLTREQNVDNANLG
jgi:hypothetical protein